MVKQRRLVGYVLQLLTVVVLFGVNRGNAPLDVNSDVCTSVKCLRAAAMMTDNMNANEHPCINYYEYACGNFRTQNQIPKYQTSVSYYTMRQNEINAKVLDFYKHADLSEYPNIRKVFAIYEQCLYEPPYGMEAIASELQKIGLSKIPPFHSDVDNSYDFATILAKLHRYCPSAAFAFQISVDLDPRNMPINRILFHHTPKSTKAPVNANNDHELDANNQEIRKSLIEYILKTVHYVYQQQNVQHTGKMIGKIRIRSTKVADFLIELDKAASIDKLNELDDVTYSNISNLQQLTDEILKDGEIQIDWNAYFKILFKNIVEWDKFGAAIGSKIMIMCPNQVKYVLRVIQRTDRDIFVCAIWFIVVQSMNYFAPPTLREIGDEYGAAVYKTEIMPSSEARKHTCLALFSGSFQDLVGFILATTEDGRTTRHEVEWMVHNIKRSLLDILHETTWLDKSTKENAIQKLASITHQVSFLNHHLDLKIIDNAYKIVSLGQNFYETFGAMTRTGRMMRLRSLLIPNDFNMRSRIGPNPAAITAIYYQDYAHLTVPIGLLGFPWYNLGLDALNYATAGTHIGHELGHAFDLQGMNHNGNGEYGSWISPQCAEEYNKRANCFRTTYGKFYYVDIEKHVDGDFTLSENIADSIGFAAALRAYRKRVHNYGEEKKLKGFEHFTHEELFLLAFANIWCENATHKHVKRCIEEDRHAPKQARVNGVLLNSKEFAAITGCPPGTPMNPAVKCEIFS